MRKLRILSYNVRMLPGVAGHGDRDLARCERIAKRLTRKRGAFDVVCLQEVFDEDAREVLIDALRDTHPHQVPLCEDDGFLNQDSGLFFASRHPIANGGRAWRFREFSRSIGWFGTEFWTDKGVFVARVELPGGASLAIANTHMQSDGHDVGRHAQIRAAQLKEVRRVVARTLLRGTGEHAAANTIGVAVGDFNVPGEGVADGGGLAVGAEYGNLRRELAWARDVYREENPASPGWTWDGPGNRAWIPPCDETQLRLDYGFVFDAAPLRSVAEPPRLVRAAVTRAGVEEFREANGDCLSDHFAVDFTLEY